MTTLFADCHARSGRRGHHHYGLRMQRCPTSSSGPRPKELGHESIETVRRRPKVGPSRASPDAQSAFSFAVGSASHDDERDLTKLRRLRRADARSTVSEGDRRLHVVGTAVDGATNQHAEQERTLFLAMLGHDLRNPLSAIATAADVLGRMHDPSATRLVNLVLASARRMARMIDELLSFAAEGGLKLRPRRTNLHRLCNSIIDEVRLAYPGRTLRLEGIDVALGYWDRDRLAQSIQNLVVNALTHGLEGAPVRVTVRREQAAFDIEVANEGAPIPPALLPHLFAPYRRGRSKGNGLGLGLHIAKTIAIAHGGDVEVDSDETSTRFHLRLPRTRQKSRSVASRRRKPAHGGRSISVAAEDMPRRIRVQRAEA